MIPVSVNNSQIGGIPDYLKHGIVGLLNTAGVSYNDLKVSGLPVIQAPTGSITAGGVITLGTALPAVYAKCWLFLPAGAVVNGVAGLYFAKMSSTTVGQVYTNFNLGTIDFMPTDPEATQPSGVAGVTAVAAVGSGAATVNVINTDSPLLSITIPGGTLGLNGLLKTDVVLVSNNSAGAKVAKQKFGATTVNSVSVTTAIAATQTMTVANRGNAASQVVHTRNFADAAVAGATTFATINSAANVVYQIASTVAVAADYMVLETSLIEIIAAG